MTRRLLYLCGISPLNHTQFNHEKSTNNLKLRNILQTTWPPRNGQGHKKQENFEHSIEEPKETCHLNVFWNEVATREAKKCVFIQKGNIPRLWKRKRKWMLRWACNTLYHLIFQFHDLTLMILWSISPHLWSYLRQSMQITATPVKSQCKTSYSPNHLLPTQLVHSGTLTPLDPPSICSSFPSPTNLKSMAQHYNPTPLCTLNSFVALLHIYLDKLYSWYMPTPTQLNLIRQKYHYGGLACPKCITTKHT